MKSDIYTLIDPALFAKLGNSVNEMLSINELVRFAGLVGYDNQEINYLMSFFFDEENTCYIEGKVNVNVKLECQRCLNLFPYAIDTTFRLYLVEEGIVNNLPKQLDVVVMKNGLVSVASIIEDELILSLPEVAKHAENDPHCQSLQTVRLVEYEVKQQKSPFSVLKSSDKTNGKK